LQSTEIYIAIQKTIFEPGGDEFTVKIAKKTEEIKGLLEVGFDTSTRKRDWYFYGNANKWRYVKSWRNHTVSGRGEVVW
jgi:hypothetical protein